jgi:hypothetical protein
MESYGINEYGERSFMLSEDATMYSYLVNDSSVENGVKLPASAAAQHGRGVILQDGVATQTYKLVQAGNVLIRKDSAAITQGDLLTPSSTAGAVRTGKPGEGAVAVALFDPGASNRYVYASLIIGGGALEIPRTKNTTVLAVDEDAKLLTVPAGYRLDALVAFNQTANAVTIKVGKTAGTQTVVAPVAVGASDLKDCTILLPSFSLTADQDLYIASSDWNSASLTVKAVMTYLG